MRMHPVTMAHQHGATVSWRRGEGTFAAGRYSRAHTWTFDGGVTVPASASPHVVRLPFSREDAVDPEEAFVAALSSCHMLTFLYLLGRAGFAADAYTDEATGILARNARGRDFVAHVTLRPQLTLSGETRPSAAELADLHHRAHDECFIANSVLTEVAIAPLPPHHA